LAQKVEIWRTGAGAYTDYSTWLTALDDHLTRKTHRVNDLQEFEFTLAGAGSKRLQVQGYGEGGSAHAGAVAQASR